MNVLRATSIIRLTGATMLAFALLAALAFVHTRTAVAGRTIAVTTTDDSGACPDSTGVSLRCAIQAANIDGSGDTITFSVGGEISPPTALPVITASNTTIDGYTAPGAQPNSQPMGEGKGDDASIAVALNGAKMSGPNDGLVLQGFNDTVRGLAIFGFHATFSGSVAFRGEGIAVFGQGEVIAGNLLGLDPFDSGTPLNPFPVGNDASGVGMQHLAQATIGGTNPADANVISGNSAVNTASDSSVGIGMNDPGPTTIEGNYIGTDESGSRRVTPVAPHKQYGNIVGIQVVNTRTGGGPITIGGTTPDARNVISGNDFGDFGIELINASNALVEGNFIGVAAGGNVALANTSGIDIESAGVPTANNAIGGAHTPGVCDKACNRIAGNTFNGVVILDAGAVPSAGVTTGNTIAGNFLGLANGSTLNPPVAGKTGVLITSDGKAPASGNTIGALDPAHANVIAGNTNAGVEVDSASNNTIEGNTITKNAFGIVVDDLGSAGGKAVGNIIGGNRATASCTGPCNVIDGNSQDGVALLDTEQTQVRGNYIGVASDGATAQGNGSDGVFVLGLGRDAAANNTIGGTRVSSTCDGTCNLISGNDGAGVDLREAGMNTSLSASSGNTVSGNDIGTNIAGTAPVANTIGVLLQSDGTLPTANNIIGGSRPGDACTGHCNLISGNTAGVEILDAGIDPDGNAPTGNFVVGNFIGTDGTGSRSVANAIGVGIASDGTAPAFGNTIGGSRTSTDCANACNLISGNTTIGVGIFSAGQNPAQHATAPNTVLGNYIGTDITGTQPLANATGLFLNSDTTTSSGLLPTAGNVIGGGRSGTACTGPCNLISTNSVAGIDLLDAGTDAAAGVTTPNLIEGNYVGTDISGAKRLVRGTNPTTTGNFNGIVLDSDGKGATTGNIIGGSLASSSCAGTCNLISGNQNRGVLIQYSGTTSSVGATGNTVSGNFIGTDVTGGTATGSDGTPLGNGVGVNVEGGSGPVGDNVIGGSRAAATCTGPCNLISGNGTDGVQLFDAGIDPAVPSIGPNRVEGDFIGTDISGTTGNNAGGAPLGNAIGVDIEGSAGAPSGSSIVGGTRTTTICTGPCDLISGNGDGVVIEDAGADPALGAGAGNFVEGDYIGTDLTGLAAVHDGVGVRVEGSSTLAAAGNTIGGLRSSTACEGDCNLISGNSAGDVSLFGAGANPRLGVTVGNRVEGNYIGTDISGQKQPQGNSPFSRFTLVFLEGGAEVPTPNTSIEVPTSGNVIGGSKPSTACTGPCNLISGEGALGHPGSFLGEAGIEIAEAGVNSSLGATDGNTVAGNFIGTNISGTSSANGLGVIRGILIRSDILRAPDADGNTVGGVRTGSACTGPCNLIDSSADGVRIDPSGGKTLNNRVEGNFIGTDVSGATNVGTDGSSLGNGTGVLILGDSNIVGGGAVLRTCTGDCNLISGNEDAGVDIVGSNRDSVSGNFIGTDITGAGSIGNSTGVAVKPERNLDGSIEATSSASTISGNVISGNSGAGVKDDASSRSDSITNNRIGVSVSGTALPNHSDGIDIVDGTQAASVSANTIAFNTGEGVRVGLSSTDPADASINQNSIFSNGNLGIDLTGQSPAGCTSGSRPGAPNSFMPCPVINTATTSQVSGTAVGCVVGCAVEVFIATGEPDDLGHGEGKTFLGSVVALGASANWTLSAAGFAVPLRSGELVTATATASVATSEFAANVTVTNASSGGITAGITCNSDNTSLPTCNPNPAGCSSNCTMAVKVHATCTSINPPSCSGDAVADLAGNALRVTSVESGGVSPESGCTGTTCSGSATYTGHGTYKGKTITYRVDAVDDEQTGIDDLWLTIIQPSGAQKTFQWTCRACVELTVATAQGTNVSAARNRQGGLSLAHPRESAFTHRQPSLHPQHGAEQREQQNTVPTSYQGGSMSITR